MAREGDAFVHEAKCWAGPRKETVDLHAGLLLALEKDTPHALEAVEESAVLLTIAWQGD